MKNKSIFVLLDSGTLDTHTKCSLCKEVEQWNGEFRNTFETYADFLGYVEDFYENEHICAFKGCYK